MHRQGTILPEEKRKVQYVRERPKNVLNPSANVSKTKAARPAVTSSRTLVKPVQILRFAAFARGKLSRQRQSFVNSGCLDPTKKVPQSANGSLYNGTDDTSRASRSRRQSVHMDADKPRVEKPVEGCNEAKRGNTRVRERERREGKGKKKKKTMYCLQDSMCDGVTREDYNISG